MNNEKNNNCNHVYHFTVKGLFLKNGIFGKKCCERCGKTIVLDMKSKAKIVSYAVLMAILMVLTIKMQPDFLVGNTNDEKVMIAVPLFITLYIAGLFLILRNVSFVLYIPNKYRNRL